LLGECHLPRHGHAPGAPPRKTSPLTGFSDALYCTILGQLEQACNGNPAMLGISVGTMYALKGQAQILMAMQDGEALAVGPTFDYVAPENRG
ncbi:hypothetical protein AB0D65_31935, partial [Streptomyces griseoloalbus]